MPTIERVLKALANRRRLGIVTFLKRHRELSVSEIAEKIRLSFKSTSRHLAVLSAADLVEKDQRGVQVYYRLTRQLPVPASEIFRHL